MNLVTMKSWIGQFILVAFLAAFTTAVTAAPKMGNEFNKTARVMPTEPGNTIEVVEVFWYGCPHCYHMDPPLKAWVKALPADVTFKRIPGLPMPKWEPMAKAFYAMEDLGIFEQYHHALFEAIHGPDGYSQIAVNEKAAIAWMSKISDIEISKVAAAFNSFSMRNRLSQARNYFKGSGATGVPSLIIDGRFITSSTMANGNEAALAVADYIIENVRADKAKAKAQ
jgi:thiol:disulfide interchange protein DsbA